jgi:hypothetical protein
LGGVSKISSQGPLQGCLVVKVDGVVTRAYLVATTRLAKSSSCTPLVGKGDCIVILNHNHFCPTTITITITTTIMLMIMTFNHNHVWAHHDELFFVL